MISLLLLITLPLAWWIGRRLSAPKAGVGAAFRWFVRWVGQGHGLLASGGPTGDENDIVLPPGFSMRYSDGRRLILLDGFEVSRSLEPVDFHDSLELAIHAWAVWLGRGGRIADLPTPPAWSLEPGSDVQTSRNVVGTVRRRGHEFKDVHLCIAMAVVQKDARIVRRARWFLVAAGLFLILAILTLRYSLTR